MCLTLRIMIVPNTEIKINKIAVHTATNAETGALSPTLAFPCAILEAETAATINGYFPI